MAIPIGTKLGTYTVSSHIGSGGMGEVYQAQDSKLGRDVAIKVLPEQFARDPERLARFQREAKMLAALNHPNIAAIYGLEESTGIHYLIMELIPGETLRDRILRDGALPVEEALKIAKQVAEALEAAHDKSIIHRDLKPANVKVTPEGRVKVLDFGLAKAFSAEPSSSDIANSPTLSMNPTMQGVIMGTAAYMSPEQAKGKSVNKATDIFAFGSVLYEMLTGRQAFHGEDVGDILATVVKSDPDWNTLPIDTPPTIKTLVRRCLRKDRNQRLQDAATLRIEIDDALAGTGPSEGASTTAKPAASMPRRAGVVLALATLLIGATAASLIMRNLRPELPHPISRLAITAPAGVRLPLLNTPVLAISPDGLQVAYVGIRDGKQQIYLRPFESAQAKPLPGTDGAESLFFSASGKWLGFFADGKLKKVSLDGGVPLVICDASDLRGVTSGDNDTIVFAPTFGTNGLSQVAAAGGKPEVLTKKDPSTEEEAHRWPQLLPGSRSVLFTGWTRNLDDSFIAVQKLDTKERKILIRGGTYARYLPSGYLVYARAETLLAVRFDLSRLEVIGDPISVSEGQTVSLGREGNAQFDVSQDGSLIYIPGGLQGNNRTLVFVDRKGTEEVLPAPPRNYLEARLSPDGQRIAVNIAGANDDIWIYDIPRQTLTRLTFGARSLTPLWTPDGKKIIYRSLRAGILNLFWKMADGTGDEERLSTSPVNQTPNGISPDGKWVVFRGNSGSAGLSMLPLEPGDRKPQPLIETTTYSARAAAFSPDGRWFAYTSDESGRDEIYIRPFPSGEGKWQVSTNGGTQPLWSRSGLFYIEGDKMMAVQVSMTPSLTIGRPQLLFEKPYMAQLSPPGITPDGQRFLVVKASEQEESASEINVILNWSEELKRRVPTGTK